MILRKCPECGCNLTQEMIDVNMCWECGKILDTSQLDEESIRSIDEQAEGNIMTDYLQCPVCGKKHHSNAKLCECGCNLISNEEWRIKTPEQKEEFKKNLKSNLENVNTIVENSMAQDIHNIAEDIHFRECNIKCVSYR